MTFWAALWSPLNHFSFARFLRELLEQLWVHFLLAVLLEFVGYVYWAILIPVLPTVEQIDRVLGWQDLGH